MKPSIAVVLLFFAATQMGLAQGYWTQLDDMPEIRYGHTVNELGGKIYLVGGGTVEGSVPPATVLVYDTATGVWSQMALYDNKARGGHCSAVVGGKLYVLGGTDGSVVVSTMEMFDPTSGQWVSRMPLPTPRGLAACVSIEGKIYVFGGIQSLTDDEGQRSVVCYDTSDGTWVRLADMPGPRWGHAAVVMNGKVYVLGGLSIVEWGTLVYPPVVVYDPATDTWASRSNLPTPRYCLTACVLNGKIYAIGGWRNSALGPIYDKVEVYDPGSDTWETETPMPVARSVLKAIALSGGILVYGGARTVHPNIGTSGIYEYRREPGLAYAQYARVARQGRDTVEITARVENPLAHGVNVAAILTSGSGLLIDSLLLRDDGLHGDSASADGLWGYLYVPKKDDTIRVTIRTQDLTSGTSRILRDAATMLFTRGALISVDTRWIDFGTIDVNTARRDTTFMVQNIGFGSDSLSVFLDYVNVEPQSAVAASPTSFQLLPGQSQGVTFTIYPRLLAAKTYNADVVIESRFGYGTRQFKKVFLFEISGVLSGHDASVALPGVFALHQNHPNPFNPSTTIKFELPRASQVTLSVYDILGRELSVLVNERRDAGAYEVKFDASELASGVYLYRLQAGDFVQSRKLLVLR